jgi:hypothetical protein
MDKRILKFRAWSKKLKRMWSWEELRNLPLSDLERDDLDWLQYSDYEDKEGKEIYEGDLLKYPNTKMVFEVIWRRGTFCYQVSDGVFQIFDQTQCEVIGNIYENPDLLTK